MQEYIKGHRHTPSDVRTMMDGGVHETAARIRGQQEAMQLAARARAHTRGR